MELLAAQCEFLILLIHNDDRRRIRIHSTHHTTGNYCCVGSHTAADSQDTLSRFHTGDILRGSLKTNQDNLLASLSPLYSVISSEDDSYRRQHPEKLQVLCPSV